MHLRTLLAALLPLLPVTALAQATPEGYLCCNMRTDGSWISDSNYRENGKRIIPAGTPLKVTGYGRYRVHVDINGGKQSIGNDYSRDLDPEAFARRYVVPEDPSRKLAGYSPQVREAIKSARLMPGMTRDQVLMSVGYPISSENPNLDARVWRYWLSSFSEFQVIFDGKGRVKEIETDPQTRNIIMMD